MNDDGIQAYENRLEVVEQVRRSWSLPAERVGV
jgi:hypothetical protein